MAIQYKAFIMNRTRPCSAAPWLASLLSHYCIRKSMPCKLEHTQIPPRLWQLPGEPTPTNAAMASACLPFHPLRPTACGATACGAINLPLRKINRIGCWSNASTTALTYIDASVPAHGYCYLLWFPPVGRQPVTEPQALF